MDEVHNNIVITNVLLSLSHSTMSTVLTVSIIIQVPSVSSASNNPPLGLFGHTTGAHSPQSLTDTNSGCMSLSTLNSAAPGSADITHSRTPHRLPPLLAVCPMQVYTSTYRTLVRRRISEFSRQIESKHATIYGTLCDSNVVYICLRERPCLATIPHGEQDIH